VQEFVDVETSKVSGRAGFNEMVTYLKKHPATCRTILVEKTDRLYRNIKDWAVLDELGVTIHFVKEGVVVGPESRSTDQFVHGIKVLMARNYSLNLGEETIKGMLEKARSGICPSFAPVGYRNADGPGAKRVIVPDPETAPVILLIYERFATGRYSIKTLVKEFNTEGLRLRGRQLSSSVVHQILRKRLYTGDFDWNGTMYQGLHEPLVTTTVWQRVQELLDARAKNKTRKVKHDFAFTGLVRCGPCGCMLVGELKKGRYVYYHCTGNRGKCPEPYARQSIFTEAFAGILQELVIPGPILEWLGDAVLESDRTEHAARDQAIQRLMAQYDRIESRIETMYMDKLDGRVSQQFFDRNSVTWRKEQEALRRKVQDIQTAAPAPIDQAIDMLQLTSRASELFLQQPATEHHRFLQMMVEKADWKDGTLRTTLFEPFEILRHSNRESNRKENENAGSGRDLEVWLPGMDSNHELDKILKSHNLLILQSR
jgi:site-specific DNA recombinase